MVAGRPAGRGTNQEAIRRHNLGVVLRHVHRAGELSRSALGRRTSLNRSTIADLAAELEASGTTERTDPSELGGMGRPSAGVRVAGSGPFVVAVELTVDRVSVARVGLGGRLHRRASAATERRATPEEVAATVAALAPPRSGSARPTRSARLPPRCSPSS